MAESGEFTWTWNASGCPNVNASVGALDASPGDDAAAASQAEAGEAAPPTSLNPGNGDAGTSGEAGTSGAWPDASRD
jgi:hypothetical protein